MGYPGSLDAVEAPVLVMNRTGNTILPMRNARALTAALPNARLAEIDGTGTAIFSDDVEQIADEIEGFLTGTRPLPRHDRVLATVLFTDVVGSTQRASQLGDRDWRELLERHHRLLRTELDRFGGHEVHTAVTASSPRSTPPGERSNARVRHRSRSVRSASRSGAAATRARSSSPTARCKVWPCTSGRGSPRSPVPVRSWSPRP